MVMDMFDTLKRLYDNGSLTLDGLKKAVVLGWITPEQYKEICGEDYVA